MKNKVNAKKFNISDLEMYLNKELLRIIESFIWDYPIGSLTIMEPQDQEIGYFHGIQERRVKDFEARKL